MSTPTNPLRAWFDQTPKPMTQRAFARQVGCTYQYVTLLLADTPPWPSRRIMREMIAITGGAVTAEAWLKLPDPPPRIPVAA